ncbi:MAG: Crp/Fnr family transcriptional regulator [Gammaproteobacteria bacterium]|nr:Crp/Fnr family transcriptional regulator [Gammaproteobacteria bacterium]MCP4983253.1 Crp/Fnr family transcriptional regulator [Gammaproteobacteria bacterium]
MEILDTGEMIETLGLPYMRELSTFGALSDEVITDILCNGVIRRLAKGEFITRVDEVVGEFQVVLRGKMAYYKRFEGHDVLTRHFCQGQQVGFDEMIGMTAQNGTDVALEDTILLDISTEHFFSLHVNYPADFGLLMINLARELAREIEILEDVIGRGTGWSGENNH